MRSPTVIEETRPNQVFGDGVEDDDAARAQHPADLGDHRGQVGDVLEHLAGHDHVRGAERSGSAVGVALHGAAHPATARPSARSG